MQELNTVFTKEQEETIRILIKDELTNTFKGVASKIREQLKNAIDSVIPNPL